MHQAASNEYRLQVRERPNNLQHSEVLLPKASTKEFELTQQRTSEREGGAEGAIATDSLNDCQLFYGSAPPLRSLDSIADSVSFAGRLIRSAAERARQPRSVSVAAAATIYVFSPSSYDDIAVKGAKGTKREEALHVEPRGRGEFPALLDEAGIRPAGGGPRDWPRERERRVDWPDARDRGSTWRQ